MDWTTTYYGTYNTSHKPKHGVHLMMLDEYIKRTIDKEREKFSKDISLLTEKFNRIFHDRLDKTDKNTQDVRMLYIDLKKFIAKIGKMNRLNMPLFEERPKKKKKPKKEVIENDGYLQCF